MIKREQSIVTVECIGSPVSEFVLLRDSRLYFEDIFQNSDVDVDIGMYFKIMVKIFFIQVSQALSRIHIMVEQKLLKLSFYYINIIFVPVKQPILAS